MSVAVDLWQWRLDAPNPRDLSEDELVRADRFVFARDRDRYIAGRARLRQILGQYLFQPADRIVFSYGPFGRPEVAGVSFNLSHTGDLASLAVAQEIAIGVDIEVVRPIDLAVAEAHFAPAEVQALMALSQSDQTAAFYRCWTRKEAYLKAIGTGLSTDLASFTVTMGPNEPSRLINCAGGGAANWSLHDFTPAPGIAGALALLTKGQAVRLTMRGAG